MPELPEVETTRRGIEPWLVGRRIERVVVREWRLRWRIPRTLPARVQGAVVRSVGRRAKYLLIGTEAGTLIWHLGMSGSLRILDADSPPLAHDHVERRCEPHGRQIGREDQQRGPRAVERDQGSASQPRSISWVQTSSRMRSGLRPLSNILKPCPSSPIRSSSGMNRSEMNSMFEPTAWRPILGISRCSIFSRSSRV